MTVYRVHWRDETGRQQEVEWPSLTEATLHKRRLRRLGIRARILCIHTLDEWDGTVDAYLRLVGG